MTVSLSAAALTVFLIIIITIIIDVIVILIDQKVYGYVSAPTVFATTILCFVILGLAGVVVNLCLVVHEKYEQRQNIISKLEVPWPTFLYELDQADSIHKQNRLIGQTKNHPLPKIPCEKLDVVLESLPDEVNTQLLFEYCIPDPGYGRYND